MALNCLTFLKDELADIQEAGDLAFIACFVVALDAILSDAKKPACCIFQVHLEEVGVMRGRLIFASAEVAELVKEGLTERAEAAMRDLHAQIKKIYACVNMKYEPGSRMILDAILLALAEIASSNIIILPEMRLGHKGGVRIAHPSTGYELWLSGNVDYMVVEYEDVEDNKARLLESRADTFTLSQGHLLLVEAKRQTAADADIDSSIPEAVSQATALLRSANLPEVHFCLSDGHTWMFFVLKNENETLTYYEPAKHHLSKDLLESSDSSLREIVQLLREWLRPTKADLFTLKRDVI